MENLFRLMLMRPAVAQDPENPSIELTQDSAYQKELVDLRRIAGSFAYVLCDAGMVVVDIVDPKCPKVASVLSSGLAKPRSMDGLCSWLRTRVRA